MQFPKKQKRGFDTFKDTSKIAEINGDFPLDSNQRKQYIQFGLTQIADHLSRRVFTETYCTDQIPTFLQAKLMHCISPLRLYTDCLMRDVIAAYCPSTVIVLDLGCGKGNYSTFFDRAGCRGLYLGLDAVSNSLWRSWLKQSPTALQRAFVRVEAETLPFHRPSINFAISSCALEHFSDDVMAIENLSKIMQPGTYSLHLVPSVWALFLYIYHGYRRYSPAALLEMFQNAGFEIVELWALGGIPSFLLHYVWITWFETGLMWEIPTLGSSPSGLQNILSKLKIGPRVRQGACFVAVYNRLLRLCLNLDQYLPFLPSGYAILVRKSAGCTNE